LTARHDADRVRIAAHPRSTGRRPASPDRRLADAGLLCALDDPEALRGFAQLVARLAVALVVPGRDRGDSAQRARRATDWTFVLSDRQRLVDRVTGRSSVGRS
jgi:hypothetical protein